MAEPAPRTRIGLVLGSSTGGTGRHVRTIATAMTERGIQVTLCAPAATIDHFGLSEAAGTVVAVELPAGTHPFALWRARRRVAAAMSGTALVHAHGLRAAAVAAGSTARAPLVCTWHNPVPSGRTGAVSRVIARRAARASALTLAVSADLAESARSLGARRVLVAPVAAPVLPEPTRSVAQVRAEFAVGDRPLVVTVARLHPQKDLGVLIDAARILSARDPAPVVLVAGDGPERAALTAAIAAAGVDVRLLGHRSDVADLLSAADVAVLTSRWEGSPLAAQEIIRAGRPLVSTDVGGIAALIGAGAVLVPPGRPDAIAAAIGDLLDDPAARESLAGRARRAALRLPTEEGVISDVLDLYTQVLAGHAGGVLGADAQRCL